MSVAPALSALAAGTLLAVALGLGSSLLRTDKTMRRARIRAVAGDPITRKPDEGATRKWHHRLGQAVSDSPAVGAAESRKLTALLHAAGFRRSGALAAFVALKTLAALAGLALAWLAIGAAVSVPVGIIWRLGSIVLGALGGWRLPDIVAHLVARRRRAAIENALPDALDLLVICAESGLALEQGLDRVARELRPSAAALAEELGLAVAEMRLLPDRWQALENFAARTGVRPLRSIVATLVQTLHYGTPLAQSLRVIAAELRTARALQIETRAARLPVLLTLPLIFFILPCLFLIIAGPTALQVYDLLHRH